MKIAESVQPIQVRRTLSSQYVQCVAKIQAALLNNFLFSFPLFGGCFVLFARNLETCDFCVLVHLEAAGTCKQRKVSKHRQKWAKQTGVTVPV
jgi:hypothetical protein